TPSLASNPANYLPDHALDTSYESLLALSDSIGSARPKGTPQHVINSLPTISYTEGKWRGKEADCAVCLETFESGEKLKAVPGCLHWFHSVCLEGWLRQAEGCPVCRTPADAGSTPG
ncbi:hypothetical protein HK097_005252, partial [Rhizophlyctis rosea]